MTIEKRTEFEVNHRFDSKNCRHYVNGVCSVLHCHHYAVLYTQLAYDAEQFDGVRCLTETSEDVFYNALNKYFTEKGISNVEDKIAVAQEYWKTVGMGLIRFTGIGKYEATAEMDYSHLDEGWLKKWGGNDKPVNFYTVGFVAAVVALVNNTPPQAYQVKETKSLVCGDDKSEFRAVLR